MPNYPYDEIKTQINREFVAGLNKNFDEVEQDLNEVIGPLQAVLDGKFDDASLATEFEARAQAKLEEIEPQFYEFQTDTTAQLAETIYLVRPPETGATPKQVTDFINTSLLEANTIGVKQVRFPYKKTYVIQAVEGDGKGSPSIVIPSNVHVDLNGSTLKIAPNNYTGYQLIAFNSDTKNSSVYNGVLEGDRHEHIYKTGTSGLDSHEWGRAVGMMGINNTLRNLEMFNFTGDGVYFGGYQNMNWTNRLFSDSFMVGGINADGSTNEAVTSSIISKLLSIADYTENGRTNLKIEPYYGSAKPIKYNKLMQVVFYKDDVLLSVVNALVMSEVIVPDGATHFKIVFFDSSLDFTDVVFVQGSLVGINNKILDCHIHHNRRQGISTSRNERGLIEGNHIHDIQGTAPQAGIDIEDSRFTLNGLTIKRNHIHDTNNSCIIAYDGFGITIENNILYDSAQSDEVGAITTQYARNLNIRNNTIYGGVRIGSSQEGVDLFNRNVFDNNLCLPSAGRYKNVVFRHTNVYNSSFSDVLGAVFSESNVENCVVNNTIPRVLTNRISIEGGKINKCKFVSTSVSYGFHFKKGSEITNSEIIDNEHIVFEDLKRFENNRLNSKGYSIKTAATDTVNIKDNMFIGQTTTLSKIEINTNTNIEGNHFKPSPTIWFTYITLLVGASVKLVRLKNNSQGASTKASAFQFDGANASAVVLSEGNYSETSGSDFSFETGTSTQLLIKSKDDMLLTATPTTDVRVVRSKSIYT